MHASQIWTTLRKSYTISTLSKKPLNVRGITRVLLNFDHVLIPALRRSYQDWCEVLFYLEGESHARQICLTLRQSYTISTLSKSPETRCEQV